MVSSSTVNSHVGEVANEVATSVKAVGALASSRSNSLSSPTAALRVAKDARVEDEAVRATTTTTTTVAALRATLINN